MNADLQPAELEQLSRVVAEHLGLHFPPARWDDLRRGIQSIARERGFANARTCAQWLASATLTQGQVEMLASHLTVGETYFFRDTHVFDALRERILPEWIAARRGRDQRLRLWSAGCSSGEEAYSLAILVRQLLPAATDWNITILGTDLNPRLLQKAAGGEFGEWSFRGVPEAVRAAFFIQQGRRWRILPEIQRMVRFEYLNLVEDVYPSLLNDTNAMDLILCRNVLMYLSPEKARRVVDGFRRALVDGGWLAVAACETSQALFRGFEQVSVGGALFYRNKPPRRESPPHRAGLAQPARPPMSKAALHPPKPRDDAARVAGAMFREAAALHEAGDYAAASEKLAVLLARDPAHAGACALLAQVRANEGRLAEALAWCDKAIAANKLSPGAHYLRATILDEQGERREAMAALRRAIYLDHDFVIAHFALANLAAAQGQASEARRHFSNARLLLEACRPGDILPESGGITAGRLLEIITSTMTEGVPA